MGMLWMANEHADGWRWTGDADPEVAYIDCDDPDCAGVAACLPP